LKPEDYDALLRQARDSEYGIRLAMQGFTPAARVRRQLYSARDRARKNGDKSFDCLSVIFNGRADIFGPGEIWVVRRDRLPVLDEPDDKLEAYPSDLELRDLPFTIRARGPKRLHISGYSPGPGSSSYLDEARRDIIRRYVLGESADVIDRLVLADAAGPDPTAWNPREMTLDEAGVILERLAILPRSNGRSGP